jgi:hypothetical protein
MELDAWALMLIHTYMVESCGGLGVGGVLCCCLSGGELGLLMLGLSGIEELLVVGEGSSDAVEDAESVMCVQ